MKKTQNPYHFLDTFCFRTPLYPLNFYKNLFSQKNIGIDALKKIWEDNTIKEAIFLASPELYKRLELYFKTGKTNNEKLEQAFLKYLIRLSTRCTPFGLFAGVATGTFSEKTTIELKPIDKYKRVTRYDTNFIASHLDYLSQDSTIKYQLLFYPNSTLYTIADQCRYIEYETINNKRTYSLEAVEHNDHINTILHEAKKGKTINQLAHLLVEKEILLEEATSFIELLIDNQILVSELELNVTGEDTLSLVNERVKTFTKVETTVSNLELLKHHTAQLDKKFGNTIETYETIFNHIEKTKVYFDKKYLFQTDVFIQTDKNSLNKKHGYSLKKVVPLLNKLTYFKPNNNLENFKKAFLKRYETREMPLTKVLDIESGIGYIQNNAISDTVPFLEDIVIPEKSTTTDEIINWTPIDDIIYQKLLEAKENKRDIIELKDSDFDTVDDDWSKTPDTLSAFVEIIKTNEEEYLAIEGFNANSGNLLARFTHGDERLLKHLKHVFDIEQKINANKIIVEIVHLPEARAGNILKRPHFRDYEIPYLAKSTLNPSQQIPINDLMVSVKNDTIILKSKKLNKIVLPRLTNAHNYKLKALPMYHFLCDLQYQNQKTYFGYVWHNFLEKNACLPRIVYKNVILSKAKWVFNKQNIDRFLSYYDNETLLLQEISQWQKTFSIPKQIALVEGDNTLLIDLEHIDSIRLLLRTVKKKTRCELEEALFAETDAIVKNNGKHYANQFIFSFYNKTKLDLAI